MKTIRIHWLSVVIVAVLAMAQSGCTPQFVGDAARSSAASFLTSVFSSAVNAAIQPQ